MKGSTSCQCRVDRLSGQLSRHWLGAELDELLTERQSHHLAKQRRISTFSCSCEGAIWQATPRQVGMIVVAVELEARKAGHGMDQLGMFAALGAEHTMMEIRSGMRNALQNLLDHRNLPK